MTAQQRKGRLRRAAAAVELAVLLPLLALMLVIAADFGRVFYFSQVIQNCARKGALHGANLTTVHSPYASIQDAALADASSLSPSPTVTSTTWMDAAGKFQVSVTVAWDFHTLTGFPGVPNTVNLSRTVQMQVATQ